MFAVLLMAVACRSVAASWTTASVSTDFITGQTVETINNDIIYLSFTSSWKECIYGCSPQFDTELVSMYYDPDSYTCHCNNASDSNAVSGEDHRIKYASISKRYTVRDKTEGITYFNISNGIFKDCSDLFNNGYRMEGVYRINQGADGVNKIYCENEWTVFQKRHNADFSFERNWNDYVTGFGQLNGTFWLGLRYIHQMTQDGNCELRIDMEAENTHPNYTSGYASYTTFWIDQSSSNYALHVSGYSGNVGDSLTDHNTMSFSTVDNDNDNSPGNCAEMYQGGWWFDACHKSNLNGLYLAGAHSTFANGMNWVHGWGYQYSLIKTEMKFKCHW